MQQIQQRDPPHPGFSRPPTQDDLPYDDGMPIETHRHVLQVVLLMETLMLAWEGRTDVFIGGNMFVYFSPDQVLTEDFRGPDVFVVQGVARRDRKSWIVWEEGKGPDVVIELLSENTAQRDKSEKKRIYQDNLRVPEYFWYDPFSGELAGFALRQGIDEPIAPDAQARLHSLHLGLALVRWDGVFGDMEATWLRWATPEGDLLPTPMERAAQAEQRLAQLEAEVARLRNQPGATSDGEDGPAEDGSDERGGTFMSRTVTATYDGEALRPQAPIDLEPNRSYRVTIAKVVEEPHTDQMPEVFRRTLDRARDLGVGDLAEQHDHYLYGTPKR